MSSICVVAGDPSGDAHAASLVEALRRLDPSLSFAGLGGPRLKQAGMKILQDLTHIAAIGPFDAVKHLRSFTQARARLQRHLETTKPPLVLLVDFGDFNLPAIAPLAKRAGCRVAYYISPQLWAWGQFRLRWVKQHVDRMIVFFKFEETFYQRHGVPVTWVGHPLVSSVTRAEPADQLRVALGLNLWRTTVGLLPGSRRQELVRHLPLMLASASRIAWHMPGVQFLIPKAPGLPGTLFARAKAHRNLDIILSDRPLADCLSCMDAAVVSSGTATLEAALANLPMVVVYKTSPLTYLLVKAFVRVPHIAMVNLIAGKTVVPEYLQYRATPSRIARELVGLLRDASRTQVMRGELAAVTDRLGPPGAVERAARVVLEMLRGAPTTS